MLFPSVHPPARAANTWPSWRCAKLWSGEAARRPWSAVGDLDQKKMPKVHENPQVSKCWGQKIPSFSAKPSQFWGKHVRWFMCFWFAIFRPRYPWADCLGRGSCLRSIACRQGKPFVYLSNAVATSVRNSYIREEPEPRNCLFLSIFAVSPVRRMFSPMIITVHDITPSYWSSLPLNSFHTLHSTAVVLILLINL